MAKTFIGMKIKPKEEIKIDKKETAKKSTKKSTKKK